MRLKEHLLLRTEGSRFILSFLFLLFAGLFTAYVQQLSDARWVATRPASSPPLEDLFNHLPNLVAQTKVVDLLLQILLALTVIALFVLPSSWTHRAVAFRRLFWVAGILYLYRALTLTVTTLPTTLGDCTPLITTGKPFFTVLWIAFQQVIGTTHSCTDLIFSGHTMIFMTCAIQFRIYSPYRLVSYYAYLHAGIGILLVILTHMHYSVDVILGIFITYGMWSVYFGLVRMAMERLAHEGRWEKFDDEYQRVAYTPRMMNSGLIRVVMWLDGIDLRWKPTEKELDPTGREMIGVISGVDADAAVVV